MVTNIIILTYIQADTKGDFFSAKKMAREFIALNHHVEWLIYFEDVNQWPILYPTTLDLGPSCKIHPLQGDLITELERKTNILGQRDLFIVYPFIGCLTADCYQKVKESGPFVFAIQEYGFDHLISQSNNLLRNFADDLRRREIAVGSTGVGNTSWGIFTKTEEIPIDLLHVPDKDLDFIRLLMGNERDLKTFNQRHAVFFSYTNTSDESHDQDLAKYFLLCIKQALLEGKQDIDLIGRVNENVVTLLKSYLRTENREQRTEGELRIRFFNPYPVDTKTMLAFINQAKLDKHPALLTGDQSTGEAIAIGSPFIYQVCHWKKGFFEQILELCKENQYKKMARFLELTHLGHFYRNKNCKTEEYLQKTPEFPVNNEIFELMGSNELYTQFDNIKNKIQSFESVLPDMLSCPKRGKEKMDLPLEELSFEIMIPLKSSTTVMFDAAKASPNQTIKTWSLNREDIYPKSISHGNKS